MKHMKEEKHKIKEMKAPMKKETKMAIKAKISEKKHKAK